MGKSKSSYKRTVKQMFVDKLVTMQRFGVSRNELKKQGLDGEVISSYATYHTYKKCALAYANWLKHNHPEAKSWKKARRFANTYLAEMAARYERGEISAATVKTHAAALNKIFGRQRDDRDFFRAPPMKRSEITRGRSVEAGSGNVELDNFGRGTGLRAFKELEVLLGQTYRTRPQILDLQLKLGAKQKTTGSLNAKEKNLFAAATAALRFKDINDFVFVEKGKGGKMRFAPIVGDHVAEIRDMIMSTPADQRVFAEIPHDTFKTMNEHALRAEYAAAIYHRYARPLDQLPLDRYNKGLDVWYSSQVYVCRRDMAGNHYDRHALGLVAVALGHSYDRVYDVVSHYSYRF